LGISGFRDFGTRWAAALVICALALGGWLGSAGTLRAQEDVEAESSVRETPLYEQDPYDLITLKRHEDDEPLKVEPLDFADRRIPGYVSPNYRLKVVLWDQPEKKYTLKWSSIAKIELFEQIVLDKAKQIAAAGDRETAYNYFQWLETRDPKLPGLGEAIDDYLYREAGIQNSKGNLSGALAILFNLYDHNPKYPKLQGALAVTEEKLLRQYEAAGDYSAVRAMLRNLRERFPDHPTVRQWESDLKARAGTQLDAARQAVARGDFRRADRALQEVVLYWPELPGTRQLRDLLHRRYPRALVGILEPAVSTNPRHRGDWAARRAGRLVYRTLTEFLGPGSEGGDYRCPVGTLEIEPLQRRMVIQIQPGLRWARGNLTLTGVDVARGLLAMAEPRDPRYEAAWSELFAGASVRDVYQVDVAMRRPHVRPDALLQTTLAPYGATIASDGPAPPNGPYTIDRQDEEETIYVANPQYFAAAPAAPKEIVEQVIRDDRQAIRALRDGQIQVLDRLYPWTLDEFRSMKDVVVEPYAAPLVHCLLPNRNRPLMSDKVFRRALVYGIHRQAILNHLLGGKNKAIEGCAVISGPFPQGTSYDDPLGYAYDTSIEPRPYEPGLAVMLATFVSEAQAAAKAKQAGQNQKKTATPAPADAADKATDPKKTKSTKPEAKILARLTLAHTADEIARTACQKIKDQLKIVGIEITLRPLPPGPCERIPDDVDLLYAELPMWEPVVDSAELLAADGPTGGSSAYMNLVLGRLRNATDWQQVRPILRQIHRIAHDDVAIIPLWQLVDHFAYHVSLQGIGGKPVSLYQNVEQWELVAGEPSDDSSSIAPQAGSRGLADHRSTHRILTQTLTQASPDTE